LRVVDQDIGIRRDLAQPAVRCRVAVLVVGDVDDGALSAGDAVAKCALRVMERKVFDAEFPEILWPILEMLKLDVGGQLVETDREVRRSHLCRQHSMQVLRHVRRVKDDAALLRKQRSEEGKSLNVVPVKMGEEQMDGLRLYRSCYDLRAQ